MATKSEKLKKLRDAIRSMDTDASSSGDESTSSAVSFENEDEPEEDETDPNYVARQKAMELLARRPHTRKELRDKLRKRDFGPSVIDAVIGRMLELNYIDEHQIAVARARSLARKHRGPIFIRRKLRSIGLDDHDIEDGLAECCDESSWTDRAENWAVRKGHHKRLTDEKSRQKLFSKLARRGFPASVARAVVFDRLSNE
jgi:regulatory protein